MDNRVTMNTATSMLNRTAVNGSGARSMFQNNYTSMGVADTAAAQMTVQRMGLAVGTSGYNTASNYNRISGLIDPTLSQASAAGAMSQMQTGTTFNTLRMFGISTIGKGGAVVTPRDLAHQFVTKAINKAKFAGTPEAVERSTGQASQIGQSLSRMVREGMIDENLRSQTLAGIKAELNAGIKGKSYDQYTSILDKYANKTPTGKVATTELASIGLTPTDLANQKAMAAQKVNQLDANNDAFSAGLSGATGLLDKFSKALTAVLKTGLGSGLGASQGFLGGLAPTAGNIGAGAEAMGGMFLAKAGAKALFTSAGRESVKAVMKAAPGVVGRVTGEGAGAVGTGVKVAAGAAKYAKFLRFSPLIGLGEGGIQPSNDAFNGKNWVDGQSGGAAAGQDRAGGASAKATGTVGAGKTASNVIAIAKKYLGIPYHYGGTSPQQGFDCSGLMQYVFRQVGVNLPRTSQAQQTSGKPVNKKDAQPGDLVFFGGNAKSGGAHHVAMLVSSSQIIEAAHTGTNVRIRSVSMNEISTVGRFLGSMGSMSTDAVANTDGASSKTGSGSSAGTSFASSFFGNALNEMDTLGGALGSFLGVTSPSGSGKGNGATKAAAGTGGTSTAPSGSIKDTLSKAGFSGSSLNMAYAIMMAESQGNARAHNGNAATGDNSYGWFQINMLGKMGPERLKQYHLSSNEDLFNTATNSRVAYEMSGGGKNWSDWSTYKNGEYKKYLGGAQKGYASGSTNIDVDQDARVHKGEMIVPTQQAEAIRQALAGNNPMSAVTGLGGKGVMITFEKESIKIILGTGATTAVGTQVGRQIVDTIVNDKRLADIAKGVS